MARPRTVDDGRILDAAVEAIGRVGPARLTLAVVAEAVGLAPATLVQRFGTKRGLLLAVARTGAGAMGRATAAAAREHAAPTAILVDALCRLAGPMGDRAALANHLAFLHLDLGDPEFLEAARAAARERRTVVAGLLREAAAAGELDPGDAEDAAGVLDAVWNGALLTWAVEGTGPLDAWLRGRLQAVLGGLRSGAHPA